MRRTKIVTTLGPATDQPDVLATLIADGVDVVRLNAAHASMADLERRLADVRSTANEVGRLVGVMLDLPGPKLRVGDVADGTELETGTEFRIESGECLGDTSHACVSYPDLVHELRPGDRVLIDDGRIELVVERTDRRGVDTHVVAGGRLASNKGVNVPGVRLGLSSITDRDEMLVRWAVEQGVDLIAQSFVRGPEDVARIKELAGAIPVVAKVEKHEAVERIEEIVRESDAVMVARGDLGVELPPERVPVLQREIVRTARAAGRPVIIATQMLESMTGARRPTRAEASDVANAIFERVDALMLSAETAIGRYPVEAVRTMARIAETAEIALPPLPHARHQADEGRDDVQRAVSDAVVDMADDLSLAAIVTPTQSGATARAVSQHRPGSPIVAATPYESCARRLTLVWGVTPLVVPLDDDTDAMLAAVLEAVHDAGLALRGDRVAITAGRATRVPGGTDFILVTPV